MASLAVEGRPTAPPAVQIPSDGPHRTTVAFKRLGPPFPFGSPPPILSLPWPVSLLRSSSSSCWLLPLPDTSSKRRGGEAVRQGGELLPCYASSPVGSSRGPYVRASLSHPAAVGVKESLVLGPTRAFLNGVVGCGSLSFSLR